MVDQYMEQYRDLQGTFFSFLPSHSQTGYECLLGAIEMGFVVDGYLVATHDTLINSWNFASLDSGTIWHSNEHVQDVGPDNVVTLGVTDSMRGILKVRTSASFHSYM